VNTKKETPGPRLAGAALCAASSLLLLVCSVQLYAGGAGGWGVGVLLVAGVGLLLAALKSARPHGHSG
jgi:hypothetical protein